MFRSDGMVCILILVRLGHPASGVIVKQNGRWDNAHCRVHEIKLDILKYKIVFQEVDPTLL